MRKKIIIIGLVIATSFSLFSQNFISTEKQWNVRLNGWASSYTTEIFKIYGDSIIDSVAYKKIWASFDSLTSWNYQGLLREDSNIVYYISPNSNEGILYDFNLEIGETIFVKNIFCGDLEIPITIIDIDTIEYLGVDRKRWHIGENGYISEYWIEDIGSLNGPLYVQYDYCIVCPVWELLCYHKNDTLLYIYPLQTECFQNTVGIEDEKETDKIILKPNPVIKGQTITIEIKTKPLSIDLLNLSGKIIESFSQITENKISIETSNLCKGMYLLRIQNKKNRMQTIKILIK
ncbi:MAG: T9SS type A sorting domain-containing protein [Bacteroidales bacterium]|nr:T9SS type A sorting domain-containing protein [Bacteroidales bacterium]